MIDTGQRDWSDKVFLKVAFRGISGMSFGYLEKIILSVMLISYFITDNLTYTYFLKVFKSIVDIKSLIPSFSPVQNVCVHVHVHVCACLLIHACVHVFVHVCDYVFECSCSIDDYKYVCMYECLCVVASRQPPILFLKYFPTLVLFFEAGSLIGL